GQGRGGARAPAGGGGGAVSAEPPVPGELAVGDHLAGYRLDEVLARGGVAVVYRAFDERLGRSVPPKVLAAALARDEAFRELAGRRAGAGVLQTGTTPTPFAPETRR